MRFSVLAVTLTLFIILPASGCLTHSPASPEKDAREAIVKFLIDQHGSDEIYSYCITFEDGKRPDREFLERFSTRVEDRHECYICSYNPVNCRDEGPRDRETGKMALIIKFKEFHIKNNTADAITETNCGSECGYLEYIRVRKENNTWKVVFYGLMGIS